MYWTIADYLFIVSRLHKLHSLYARRQSVDLIGVSNAATLVETTSTFSEELIIVLHVYVGNLVPTLSVKVAAANTLVTVKLVFLSNCSYQVAINVIVMLFIRLMHLLVLLIFQGPLAL